MNFKIPEIKVPKSLSQGWKQMDAALQLDRSFLRFLYLGVAVIAVCFAIYFFVDSFAYKYPSLSKEEYQKVSTELDSLIALRIQHPEHSIQGLEDLGLLPELLENRKNYTLGGCMSLAGRRLLLLFITTKSLRIICRALLSMLW